MNENRPHLIHPNQSTPQPSRTTPMLELSAEQTMAARLISDWYVSHVILPDDKPRPNIFPPKPYFFLTGPAGSGKTSLIGRVITTHLNLPIPTIQEYRQAEQQWRNSLSSLTSTTDAINFDQETPNRPPSYPVAFAAFTAKAAQVMQSRHIPASTIHALIYSAHTDAETIYNLERSIAILTSAHPSPPPISSPSHPLNAEYRALNDQLREAKQPRFSLILPKSPYSRLRNTKLLVLDECSMIGETLWQDLLACQIPMLILGDLKQLQPVKDLAPPFYNEPPDFELTEIHRQLANSPIINYATAARTHKLITYGRLIHPNHSPQHPQLATRIPIKQFEAQHLTRNDLMWFDQIICATHRRRQYLNRLYRSLLLNSRPESLPVFPQLHEKILCGENDHKLQLFNGVIYIVTAIDQSSYQLALDSFIDNINPNTGLNRPIKFQPVTPIDPQDPFGTSPDPSTYFNRQYDRISFELTATDPLSPNANELDRSTSRWVRAPVATFLDYNDPQSTPSNDFEYDYGYAITVHKSQGSQWSRVLVWNERLHAAQTEEEYARWLYTAITRASDCIVLAG